MLAWNGKQLLAASHEHGRCLPNYYIGFDQLFHPFSQDHRVSHPPDAGNSIRSSAKSWAGEYGFPL
jgi:hypothetical protein